MLFLIRRPNKIYIMSSPSYPGRLKIGVSNRPKLRATQVGKGKNRVEFEIGMPFAYQVEGAFHSLFAGLNAPTSGDGRTEWFSPFLLGVVGFVGCLYWWLGSGQGWEVAAVLCALSFVAAYLLFYFTVVALLVLVRLVFEGWPLALIILYHYF
jgi:hypothetical protein